MYYKMSNEEQKIYNRARELTITDYEAFGDFIEADKLWSIIEDLICEVDHKQEELDDLQQNVEENCRPIPVAEQYNVSDSDFIQEVIMYFINIYDNTTKKRWEERFWDYLAFKYRMTRLKYSKKLVVVSSSLVYQEDL